MLQRLYIKNVALITEADITFDEKLNVLSGETGSGKSVILESINFVLGSKADKTMIRYGEQEAMVRAEFCVSEESEALSILKSYDIESDGEIIITRKFSVDGKGGIKINGNTVTASMLKSVTQKLVDVHGQSEHFFLLGEDNQLKVVDSIAGDKIGAIKQNILELIAQKRALKAKIEELGGDESERERKLDMLDFQIKEIESADLKVGEYDELVARRNLIANTEKILTALGGAGSIIGDDGGCLDLLTSAKHQVGIISNLSEEYDKIFSRIESLAVEASDIAETISDLCGELSLDEREVDEIEERISLIKSLRKKYGADEESILSYLEDAKNKYDILSDSATAVEKYNKQLTECDDKIFNYCLNLTKLRKEIADKFCKEVVAELKTLNISNAQFTVNFNDYDRNTANLNSQNGSDGICFMFSANKGEPLKPLSKVISGGEMSRFMLAIKTCLHDINGISTYIFDEIDAGISGFTAMTVAEKFVAIAEGTQIIAVSHLPQICASSSSQYLIYKEQSGEKTFTRVKKLSHDEKIKEITRLTGSVESEAAIEHAKELVAKFSK